LTDVVFPIGQKYILVKSRMSFFPWNAIEKSEDYNRGASHATRRVAYEVRASRQKKTRSG
jgi:hypothetical protein